MVRETVLEGEGRARGRHGRRPGAGPRAGRTQAVLRAQRARWRAGLAVRGCPAGPAGGMGRVQLFEICLSHGRSVYSPGEPLAGAVRVRLGAPLPFRGGRRVPSGRAGRGGAQVAALAPAAGPWLPEAAAGGAAGDTFPLSSAGLGPEWAPLGSPGCGEDWVELAGRFRLAGEGGRRRWGQSMEPRWPSPSAFALPVVSASGGREPRACPPCRSPL